jgi:hypothetical protein
MNPHAKKAVLVMLALLIVFSLAACSKKEEPGASEGQNTGDDARQTQQAPDAAEENEDEKLVTLEWLTYQYGPVDENAPIKKFVEEKFNVKLNIWYMDVTKRQELLGAKLAGGEIPDFMTIYSSADLKRFYDEGITISFTQEELEKYMPNYKKLIDEADPNIWKYAKVGDEYLGIPSLNVDGVFSLATAWNKTWLDNVGITKVPETLEEYEEAVYKFRHNDPDKNGKKDTYGLSRSGMTNVYGAYGVYPEFWTERDGKLVWSGILPETKEALAKLRQWKQDDVIDPEWVIGENSGGYWAVSNAFVNGKIGVSSHGSYYHWSPEIPEYNFAGGDNYKLFKEATKGQGEIAFGKPPVGPDGKFGNITPGLVGSTYMAFGKNAADPVKKHRIMKMWDAFYSDFDLFVKVKYGNEGESWQRGVDGKSIEWKEGYTKLEEQAKIGGGITFTPFGHPDFSWRVQKEKSIQNSTALFKFDGAGYSNALKSPLPSEGEYYQSLIKLQQDTFTAIINGDKPLDEFDKFVEEWKKSGGDILTKEANEWYSSLH